MCDWSYNKLRPKDLSLHLFIQPPKPSQQSIINKLSLAMAVRKQKHSLPSFSSERNGVTRVAPQNRSKMGIEGKPHKSKLGVLHAGPYFYLPLRSLNLVASTSLVAQNGLYDASYSEVGFTAITKRVRVMHAPSTIHQALGGNLER